jgi:hypothetical protein
VPVICLFSRLLGAGDGHRALAEFSLLLLFSLLFNMYNSLLFPPHTSFHVLYYSLISCGTLCHFAILPTRSPFRRPPTPTHPGYPPPRTAAPPRWDRRPPEPRIVSHFVYHRIIALSHFRTSSFRIFRLPRRSSMPTFDPGLCTTLLVYQLIIIRSG